MHSRTPSAHPGSTYWVPASVLHSGNTEISRTSFPVPHGEEKPPSGPVTEADHSHTGQENRLRGRQTEASPAQHMGLTGGQGVLGLGGKWQLTKDEHAAPVDHG